MAITDPGIAEALRKLPAGLYIVTAAHEGARGGMLVRHVQQCGAEPLLVCVAAPKGHSVEVLIRDSRAFAVCAVDAEDKVLMRAFSNDTPPDQRGDPFASLPVGTLSTRSPVLLRSGLVLDCALSRHFDLEGDHGLYVGEVVAGCVGGGVVPATARRC